MRCHGTFLFLFKQNSDAARYLNGRFMKGMIMAYSLAVVSTSGITTSTTVYEFYLLLIYAMTTLTNVVLLPMIKILFVLKIINHISKKNIFKTMQNARRCDQVFAQRIPKCPVRSPADPVDDSSSR